jgi:hypothetical protein
MNTRTETYHIQFDPAINAVVMEWNGYSNSNEFREGTEFMLNTMIQHKTSKVLALLKDMTLIGSEDQVWLEKQFLPRAVKFGFKTIAIVRPQSHFNSVAIESVKEKANGMNLSINIFNTTDEAIELLKNMN